MINIKLWRNFALIFFVDKKVKQFIFNKINFDNNSKEKLKPAK